MRLLFLSLSAPRNAENQDLKAWQEHTPFAGSEPNKIQIYRPDLWFCSPLGRSSGVERSSVWTLILSAIAIGIVWFGFFLSERGF